MPLPSGKHLLDDSLRDCPDLGFISGDHAMSGYIEADIHGIDRQIKTRFRRARSWVGFSGHIDKEEKVFHQRFLARVCEIDINARSAERAKIVPTITKV